MWYLIHGPQKINPTDFVALLTVHLASQTGQSFHLSGELPPHPLEGLAQKFEDIHGSQIKKPNEIDICGFDLNDLTTIGGIAISSHTLIKQSS